MEMSHPRHRMGGIRRDLTKENFLISTYIDYQPKNYMPAANPQTKPEAMGDTVESVLVYNLVRTHNVLAPLLDSDLRGARLTAAQFNALLALRAEGTEGLNMGELGRRLVVTKSNVTGLVDRLERRGWVIRRSGTDRRAIRVLITPEGKERLKAVEPAHAKVLAELTSALDGKEKAELVRLLTKLRRALRERKTEGA